MNQMYEKGDKTALQALVELVEDTSEANYTPASWEDFEEALDSARNVLSNDNAIDTAVDEAFQNLRDAFRGLVRKANLAALNAAIALAQQILDDENIGDYIPASIAGLPSVLAAAIAVRDNPDATQAAVDAARATLNAEILKARLKANLSALLAALEEAQNTSRNRSRYTVASMAILSAAIGGAETIVDAPIEEVTQEQVDTAVQVLYNALAGLVPVTESTDGADTSTPESELPVNIPPLNTEKAPAGDAASNDTGSGADENATTPGNEPPVNTPPLNTEKAPAGDAASNDAGNGADKNVTAPKKSSSADTSASDKKKASVNDPSSGGSTSSSPASATPAKSVTPQESATQPQSDITTDDSITQNSATADATPDIVAQAPSLGEGAGTSIIDEYVPLSAQNEEGASADMQYTVLIIALLIFAGTAIWIIVTGRRRRKDTKGTLQ
jgi:hypothetical protein